MYYLNKTRTTLCRSTSPKLNGSIIILIVLEAIQKARFPYRRRSFKFGGNVYIDICQQFDVSRVLRMCMELFRKKSISLFDISPSPLSAQSSPPSLYVTLQVCRPVHRNARRFACARVYVSASREIDRDATGRRF